MNFKNKKILITGGTGGIGNALVKKFIELGGRVLATGTKIDKLDELKKILTEFLQKFDISEHSNIENFIENINEELGGIDILINNAGLNKDNLSLRMKEDEWKKVIDINLTSTFLLTKYSIKKNVKK